MSIEFENPLTAGTVLVREQIQSQNYAAGSTGWVIKSNGDAEFNSVVIRGGTVVSGTALYYDGAPGAGTLFLAIAAAAGTDAYGNTYEAGLTVGKPGESQMLLASRPSGAGVLFMPTNLAAETREASVVTEAINEGTANEHIITQLQGAERNSAGFMVADLNSGNPAGTGLPTFRVIHSSGSAVAILQVDQQRMQLTPRTASANSALYVNVPSGHTGNLLRLQLNAADRFTVNAAGNVTVVGSLTAGNIDHGQVTATLSAASTVDVTVTFAKTFPNTPRVTALLVGQPTLPAGSSALIVRAFNITTTGCTLRVNDVGAVARTLSIGVDWHAISA